MTDFPDRVRLEDLPHLTTKELTTLYTQRYKNADAVWSQLLMRVSGLEICEKQIEMQTHLLKQCYDALKQHSEHSQLVQMLTEHFEDYGIEETK